LQFKIRRVKVIRGNPGNLWMIGLLFQNLLYQVFEFGTQPTQQTERPLYSMNRTDRTDRIDRIDPTDPMDPTNPSNTECIFPSFLRKRQSLLKIGVISLSLGILYWPVFRSLILDWSSNSDFSHGFLIPFISGFLIWHRRDQLDQLCASPRNTGLLFVLLGLFLFLLGYLASEAFTTRLSFLIVLAGVTVFLLGWPYLRVLAFPIGFLIFMIPIPSILMDKVTFPMQLFASRVAEVALRSVGIPTLREGNILQLPQTTLEVAEACSGILVNAMRVTSTGVLANYYGICVAQGFFHRFSGYVLFLFAFILLFLLGLLLSKISHESRTIRQD
jgi:hypothetical protein